MSSVNFNRFFVCKKCSNYKLVNEIFLLFQNTLFVYKKSCSKYYKYKNFIFPKIKFIGKTWYQSRSWWMWASSLAPSPMLSRWQWRKPYLYNMKVYGCSVRILLHKTIQSAVTLYIIVKQKDHKMFELQQIHHITDSAVDH